MYWLNFMEEETKCACGSGQEAKDCCEKEEHKCEGDNCECKDKTE
jgi:hypothetical protein